jgi:phosphonate degradation associated HDIG domain protein
VPYPTHMPASGRDLDVSARIDRLIQIYQRARGADYIGEGVSQLQHALQAAHLAREASARDDEVLAALLHDVGHLCEPEGERMRHGAEVLGAERHEDVGANFLTEMGFGSDITELVRGHVEAKRYLVATRRAYAERLSEASVQTLALQGGPMNATEQAAFEAAPDADAMLRVRSWDEAAKHPDLPVPEFDAYVSAIRHHLNSRH